MNKKEINEVYDYYNYYSVSRESVVGGGGEELHDNLVLATELIM